jgi:hypothetical protein
LLERLGFKTVREASASYGSSQDFSVFPLVFNMAVLVQKLKVVFYEHARISL